VVDRYDISFSQMVMDFLLIEKLISTYFILKSVYILIIYIMLCRTHLIC